MNVFKNHIVQAINLKFWTNLPEFECFNETKEIKNEDLEISTTTTSHLANMCKTRKGKVNLSVW